MPRRPRSAPGGYVYHALNRAAGRRRELFAKPADYAAFERILAETQQRIPGVRLLAYCLMPTHWHLVLWPRRDGELSRFLRLLTVTHAQRLHAHRHTAGTGPIYQGRFKSFPVEADGDRHFLLLCRYVERNPLNAKIVRRAENWPWSSLHRRLRATRGTAESQKPQAEHPPQQRERHSAASADKEPQVILNQWPVRRPRSWVERVNEPLSLREQAAMHASLTRSRPLGSDHWTAATVARLKLQWTVRPRGRPKKTRDNK
jgi:putative transposase